MHLLRVMLLLWVGLGALGSARAAVDVPPLTGRVVDTAQLLAPHDAAALTQQLAAFEARKGSQIAVLTIATTAPEDIAQFGIRVADAWKIGRKQVDDGVILIVARDDRAVRLEVGYGLEGVLPDAVARRIIDEIIVPAFRAGDFSSGITAGVDTLIKQIDGEPLPAPVTQRETGAEEGYGLIVMGGLLFGWLLALAMKRSAAAGVAALASGAAMVGFFGFSLLALLMAVFVFAGVAGGRRGGGWVSPGRGGGLGSGWGGGGFGGGGGGFGGGGASGRW